MLHGKHAGRRAGRGSHAGKARSTLRLSKKRFPYGRASAVAARIGFGVSQVFTAFKRGGM